MSLSSAMAALDAWTPTGVTNLGFAWNAPNDADLPALVVDLAGNAPFLEGLESANVKWDAGTMTVSVRHDLLIAGIAAANVSDLHDDALAHIDDYMSVAAGDLTLADSLIEPLRVIDVRVGAIEHGGVMFFGVRFVHLWHLWIAS